jgi:microcystin-dependent protein
MSIEGILGEVRVFAGFIPRGWLPCDGSLLPITGHTALFSLIGARFGGDGKTNFGVPDLRGATAIGVGTGTLGQPVKLAEKTGAASVTLKPTEVPPHTHPLNRKGATATDQKAYAVGTNSNLAQVSHFYGAGQHELVPHLLQNAAPNNMLDAASISPAAGDQPHPNMQPYQVLNFGICADGLYPSRP